LNQFVRLPRLHGLISEPDLGANAFSNSAADKFFMFTQYTKFTLT